MHTILARKPGAKITTNERQMPKLKTHRGAAKRFKKSATGKISPGEGVQAAHSDQQDQKAETRPARHGRRRRRRCPQAGEDVPYK